MQLTQCKLATGGGGGFLGLDSAAFDNGDSFSQLIKSRVIFSGLYSTIGAVCVCLFCSAAGRAASLASERLST